MPEDKDSEKDINKYVLPKSKRTLTIHTEDNETYTFELERPRTGARDQLLVEHKLLSKNQPELEGKTLIDFNKAVVRCVCKSAHFIAEGKDNALDLNYALEKDTLDSALFDILVLNCQMMLGTSERDKYFRSGIDKR